MKITKTMEYMKTLHDIGEKEVLEEYGFEDFKGCKNLDNLFQITSTKCGKYWMIEKAEYPSDIFGYVSADSYTPIIDELQEMYKEDADFGIEE